MTAGQRRRERRRIRSRWRSRPTSRSCPPMRWPTARWCRPAGSRFTAVHTPGHTSNHTCWALAEEQALFTGDHIMGWSTTVVSPPDGDMTAYIDSLRKVAARDDTVLWPTHGPPRHDAREYVPALVEHRLQREAAVLAAVRAGHVVDPRHRRAALRRRPQGAPQAGPPQRVGPHDQARRTTARSPPPTPPAPASSRPTSPRSGSLRDAWAQVGDGDRGLWRCR